MNNELYYKDLYQEKDKNQKSLKEMPGLLILEFYHKNTKKNKNKKKNLTHELFRDLDVTPDFLGHMCM